MMEIILAVATILGAFAAFGYFYDKYNIKKKDIPQHSSTVIELAWHLSMLSWSEESIERKLPLPKETLEGYAEEALKRVNFRLRRLQSKELDSSQNHFENVSFEISNLSKELRSSFFIGNILGRCQFYGIDLIAAKVIPINNITNHRILERLSEAKSRLTEASLPKNLLDGFDKYWREVLDGKNLEKYLRTNDIERERVFSDLINSLDSKK